MLTQDQANDLTRTNHEIIDNINLQPSSTKLHNLKSEHPIPEMASSSEKAVAHYNDWPTTQGVSRIPQLYRKN